MYLSKSLSKCEYHCEVNWSIMWAIVDPVLKGCYYELLSISRIPMHGGFAVRSRDRRRTLTDTICNSAWPNYRLATTTGHFLEFNNPMPSIQDTQSLVPPCCSLYCPKQLLSTCGGRCQTLSRLRGQETLLFTSR